MSKYFRLLPIALIVVGATTFIACAKKKKKGSDTSSASAPVATAAPSATPSSSQATLNLNLLSTGSASLVGEEVNLAATDATVTCSVPPAVAASGCSATADQTTGQAAMANSCLTPSGTTCQLSAGGSVVANLPVAVSTGTSVTVNIDADKSTGATNVAQIDANGNLVPPPPPNVPAAVQAFTVTPGVYSFTFCKGKQSDADANRFPDFNSCTKGGGGFTQSGYLNFTAGTATQWPVLEFWRSQDALNKCLVNGTMKYSMSDGTNTFTPKLDANNQFDALTFKATMVANGWVPSGASIRNKFSSPSLSPTTTGGSDQKARELLASAYSGKSDICAALASDLKTAWDAATLTYAKGQPSCTGVNANIPGGLGAMFNTSPEMLGRCGKYKAKKDGYGSITKFQAECAVFIAGKPGAQEKAQSDLQLVDAFLQSMSELRHKGGDDRMTPLKNAFGQLPADLSTLSPSSSTYDTQLMAFMKIWAGVSWDWQVTRLAPDILANFTTAIAADQKKPFLQSYVGQTGRQILVGWLQDATRQQQIQQLVCNAGSNSAENLTAAFRLIGSKPSVAALLADFNVPTAGGGAVAWKSTVTQSQKCTDLAAVYSDALAAPGLAYCAKVQLQTMTAQVSPSCTDQTRNAWIYMAVDAAAFSNALTNLAALLVDPDGDGNSPYTAQADGTYIRNSAYTTAMATSDYAALKAAAAKMSAYSRGSFFTQMLSNIDGGAAGTDPYAKLYRLTQNILDQVSRDSGAADPAYQAKLVALQQNSSCLFDAVVKHDPVFDANGNSTFAALVRSPVYRQFAGPVQLSTNSTASTSYFEAVDQRLQTGGDCTWGSRQDANNISIDASGNITFSFTQSWIQCNQGQGATQPAPDVMFVKGALQNNN